MPCSRNSLWYLINWAQPFAVYLFLFSLSGFQCKTMHFIPGTKIDLPVLVKVFYALKMLLAFYEKAKSYNYLQLIIAAKDNCDYQSVFFLHVNILFIVHFSVGRYFIYNVE